MHRERPRGRGGRDRRELRCGTIATPVLLPPGADVEHLDAGEILRIAAAAVPPQRLAMVTSFGAEGMVILDHLAALGTMPRVVLLDTGRLPAETHDTMEAARRRYGIDVELLRPDAAAVDKMVAERGEDLFYRSVEDRVRCCSVRKVDPLRAILGTVDAWITGLRRDQAQSRAAVAKIGVDIDHGGIGKIAPLADWSRDRVWSYIREHDVPYNRLYDEGYPSIGCAPCTRATGLGEDERAGRWWWERATDRECGIHFDPVAGRVVREELPVVTIDPTPRAGAGATNESETPATT